MASRLPFPHSLRIWTVDDNQLHFPSGRSVGNCRNDAKRLARDSGIPLAAAQDRVAAENGGAGTWAQSLRVLRERPSQEAIDSLPSSALPFMKREDVLAVISKHPITLFGYGPYRDEVIKLRSYRAALEAGQEQLLNRIDECNKAVMFLRYVNKRKTLNSKVGSSYGLKHRAEGFLKSLRDAPKDPYVANGAFICAAIHAGFEFKTHLDSPNVTFNMSSRSPVFEWGRLKSRARASWAMRLTGDAVRLKELEDLLELEGTTL